MRYYIAAFRSRNQTMVFSQILSSYNIKNRIINMLFIVIMALILLPFSALTAFATEPGITEVGAFGELLNAVNSDKTYIKLTTNIKDIVPDDEGYAESSGKIMGDGTVTNSGALSPDAMMVDRASAVAKVMLESLKESANMVATVGELEMFLKKSSKYHFYF